MASHRSKALVSVVFLALLGSLCAALGRTAVFEIEIPELGIASTAAAELSISPAACSQIMVHILNPQADEIDYGQIFSRINGEAAARIQEVGLSERGKIVRLHLNKWPGFQLISGRNTIEVEARNQRGRVFYSSFVLHTTRQNPDFIYNVELGNNPDQQTPPEIFLFEPESAIELSTHRKSKPIRIAGLATAEGAISRIEVDGAPVTFQSGSRIHLREIGLLHEENRVFFESIRQIGAVKKQITVEAVDRAGNKTQLVIPVRGESRNQVREFRGRKFALVVGISKFRFHQGGLNDLKFADADARSVYQFLRTKSAGSFLTENVRFFSNEQGTLKNMRDALSTFVAQIEADDLLLIFFASHGTPDPYSPQELYFVVHDTSVDKMSETALAMKEFKRLLEQNLRARRVLILIDTCHSAGLTGDPYEASRAISNNLVNLYAEKLLYKEEGTAVITSSDVNETSQEGIRWGGGHGVFSHFVLQGLNGNADHNSDGLVTTGELFRYVRSNVRFETEFRQNPRMMTGANEDLVLSAVSSPIR